MSDIHALSTRILTAGWRREINVCQREQLPSRLGRRRRVHSTSADIPARKKAYEEVADELRGQIVNGERAVGDRLPNENALADQFGVSRATIREALRVLTAQDLIRTAKGAGGGSYVQVPSVSNISDYLHSSINVLTAAEHVTVEELLEARELLEVPAARLAAERRANGDVARLREASTPPARRSTPEEFAYNTDFHAVVLATCGNTLLAIAAQPVFTVLMTGFARSSLGTASTRPCAGSTARSRTRSTPATATSPAT